MHQRGGVNLTLEGQCDGVSWVWWPAIASLCGDKRSSLLCAMPAVAMVGRDIGFGEAVQVFQPVDWLKRQVRKSTSG